MGTQNAAPPRLAGVRDLAAGHVTRPDTRTAPTRTVTPTDPVPPTNTAPPADIVRAAVRP